MAKTIRQYRYYNESDSRNQPTVSSGEDGVRINFVNLSSGSIFFQDSRIGTITQLGIQALPGTKFYLNNGEKPIVIGVTGIYELDLEGISEITALSFEPESIARIRDIDNAYLIVDAIYNAEG